MSEKSLSITLNEWETKRDELTGFFLDESAETKRGIDNLGKNQRLNIRELKNGLEISAKSYVGRIRIGNVTILPKIKGGSLLRLLRYAFGFRQLKLMPDSPHLLDRYGYEDLLIAQLNAEAQELITRGLQRTYVRQIEQLSSPRGRIAIDRIAIAGGTATATLPCRHFPRVEDSLLNQVLLAGLRLAAAITGHFELRRESNRLASLMEENVSRITLSSGSLDRADTCLTRLTTAYDPSLLIIRSLFDSQGINFKGQATVANLRGCLFDMNGFFQSILYRFLKENLDGYTVRDEHGLKGMMRYHSDFNPQNRQSPTPRPDYAILCKGQLVSLLDAKYRDLWEKRLPRGMLYQLVAYAISHQKKQSSILYPTTDTLAKEARIDVTDPLDGNHLGQVCLRPVSLAKIEELVSENTESARRQCQQYAMQIAFGTQGKS